MSVLQQPVLFLNVSDLQQHLQPSGMSFLQLLVLLLDVSTLHQPVLPLACLFYSILCCHWRACSKAPCALPGVSVLQQPLLLLACLFCSSLCCLWRVCFTAAFVASGVSVLLQVLPQDVFFVQHPMLPLPWVNLLYSTADFAALQGVLSYSSLFSNF
jgi:hypothetical protein